ncbi:MGH1-like glycoside hydrolase domain-containing protein [Devosia sp. Root635]|uniref:MGH1-like glycoside hydrolase domain-containing protein n=1 Tax=Devosia sp. Root635 TaxID=1736575 RepID=UPI0006FA46AC|nr:hypothetical protein [Devosia sp. Root635]KRA41775.1 hypothetical protein ASD80_12130 [Devosia sp. Root635]
MMSHSDLLTRLRATNITTRLNRDHPALTEWLTADIAFATSSPRLEARYSQAVSELLDCIKPTEVTAEILHEGGVYHGCWLESTGTINTELMARFLPSVAAETYAAFATHQREDGLIPYKITQTGPAFAQIQLVTPLARSVWNHYALNHDRAFLARMYAAMSRYDAWLATYRDTRNTGAVEAFCTYDTGHDLSARFWHVPDSPFANDPARCDPDSPVLPFIAPDLTANVICQRLYLARIAAELGEDPQPWRDKADRSLKALFTHCYDPDDHFFYDRDRNGNHVRVQSDVLLRVLACEVGDDAFFAEALSRYLLNTSKFFAKYPFTSIALDDPRFDPNFGQNSWSGPSNFLSIIRAAHAFEHHGRHVELTWAQQPILAALFAMDSFPQTLSPFTGAAGYTEKYSPAILCLLDLVERLCGILPRPDGTLWFTGLVPREATHRHIDHQTAYRRKVDGHTFELLNDGTTATLCRDGEKRFTFPHGTRLVTDRTGKLLSVTGMVARSVTGTIETQNGPIPISIGPNEVQTLQDGILVSTRAPDLVPPSYA